MANTGVPTSELYFQEFGVPSHPPLLLIHGLEGDSSTKAPLAKRFARRFRVIAIDALGHGRSPKPAGFSLEDSGRAVGALVSSLGYDSAVVLGVSMGSYVAAQAAIPDPSRVAKLVLVVTKGHGMASSVAAFAARNGFDLTSATMEETIAFMTSALWSPNTPQDARDDILALLPEDAWQPTAEARAAIEESLADFDPRPNLPSITAPTLVISGLSDGLNPPEPGREVAHLIPGARFEVYEHSGHMLASEETDRLLTDVTELIFS